MQLVATATKYGGTITHAARALGVSHATLSDVLSGNRGVGQKLLNGLGLRLGLYLNETDWWLCTAAFVAVAAQSEEGALLYPFWMLEAVPSHLIPG